MTPIREWPRGEASIRTSKYAVRIRLPSRMTVRMSWRRVSRKARGKPKPSLCARVLRGQFDGETFSSLLAAAAEHFASPARLHAGAKPVSLDAALVAGTIGWLTHGALQKRYERTCGADR